MSAKNDVSVFSKMKGGITAAGLLAAILSSSAQTHLPVQAHLPAQTHAQSGSQPGLKAVASGNRVQLQLFGAPNRIYQIEASTDLVNWVSIGQWAGGNGSVTINDPYPGPFQSRFYRAVQQAASSSSLLDLGGAGYAPDKILVKPKPGMSLHALDLTLGLSVLKVFPAMGNLEVVKVPPAMMPSTLIAQYLQSGQVQYAEHDYYVHALATPNDPYFPDLWAFHNTAQFGGKAGADIDAPDAWDVQHDANNIIVAVVDTGVRYTHEDLAANMWVNPVDGSHGTNVLQGNTDPNDTVGHGTHVAGIIGAVGNNGVGVAGVAWHVQLMACRFLDADTNTGASIGTVDGAVAALDYARSHGANIVNASWGASGFTSQALHDAVASLRAAGILFVAAAGNSAEDNEVDPVYPASYADLDNVISVAATDESDTLATFSNYGQTNVDLAAPGADIYSCWNGSDTNYQYDDGTSMSCPMVSGAAALMEAHFPGENYLQIKQQLLANVDPLPSLQGKCISGGRLNLYKALTAGAPPPTLTASFSANPASGQAPLTVQFTDASTGNPTSWNWNFGDGATNTVQNPSHTYASAGTYTASLTVTGGGQTSSASQTITVTNGSSSGLPVITLAATQPDAYVSGQGPGVINFHRTGDTNQSYQVYWTFSGTASNGVDFEQLPTNYSFPTNTADAQMTITPINHGQTNDTYVTVTLAPGSAYQIGASNSATVIIHGLPPGPPGPTASFTASPTSGQAPLTVQFDDTSTGSPTNWDWSFGDGTPDSPAQNPSHTYSSAGNFTVMLTVTGNGQSSSASQTLIVTNASASVNASFTASPTSGQAPLTVHFTDTSSGPVTSWLWHFGDGDTSSFESPSHIYTSTGTYTAMLTVTGSGGQSNSASQTITVTSPPPPVEASFTASPTNGQAPLTVQFTDQSSGPVVSWNWDFGDGDTSTNQNPSYTYTSAGTYTAMLTVTGSSGQTSSASQTIAVMSSPPPVTASFSANPTNGQAPLTVQFTDQSSGPVVLWNWDFGDGDTSTNQSPSYTYTSAGTYTAMLTVTGSSGQTNSASQTITVSSPPPASTITVVASQPLATSLTPGVFTVSRSGSDTSSDLVVNYSLGGTAQNSVDYQTLGGSVVIPAGYTSATVVVNPLGLLNLLKTVVLTISPDSSYSVGSPSSATVEIVASLSL